ncbi:MAG: NTP transferase domain-containing protein [Christensenellales bacterium]
MILCAGKGERARLGYNKTLHPLGSASVAAKSADVFSDFDEIIVVCRPEDEEFLRGQIDFLYHSFGAEKRARTAFATRLKR